LTIKREGGRAGGREKLERGEREGEREGGRGWGRVGERKRDAEGGRVSGRGRKREAEGGREEKGDRERARGEGGGVRWFVIFIICHYDSLPAPPSLPLSLNLWLPLISPCPPKRSVEGGREVINRLTAEPILPLLNRVPIAMMAIPYTGLFIAASCNSQSSHGDTVHPVQYRTLSVRSSYKCKTTGTEL
jgi:hypothetical protein